jgi:hypothetical protein
MATSTPDEPIAVAVWFMASQGGQGPRKVLAAHHLTHGGYCAGGHHPPQKWPCTAASVALRAQEHHAHDSHAKREEPKGRPGQDQTRDDT